MHDRGGDAADQAGRRVDQRLQRDQPPRPRAVHLKTAAQRGFKIASVGNDPKDKTIKDVAHIRYGPEEESAKLLAQHIKGAKAIQDKRKGDAIDLALGTVEGVRPGADPDDQGDTAPCPTITVGLTRLRAGRGWRRAGP